MKFLPLKKSLLSLSLFLLVAIAAHAQDRASEGAKAVTAQMKEQLDLNDNQFSKVHAVNLDFYKKAAEATKITNKVDKAKKLRVVEEERDTKLKSVLTDAQFKTYIANKGANRKKLIEYTEAKK